MARPDLRLLDDAGLRRCYDMLVRKEVLSPSRAGRRERLGEIADILVARGYPRPASALEHRFDWPAESARNESSALLEVLRWTGTKEFADGLMAEVEGDAA